MPKGRQADGDPDEGIRRPEHTREGGQKIRSSQPVREKSAPGPTDLGMS